MRINRLRQRDFVAALGGAVVWPLAARAQQPTLPVIGYLAVRAPSDESTIDAGFRRGLAEYGYVEGQNVAIEYRLAGGNYSRFPALAAELARLPVNLFITSGGDPPALAAKAARRPCLRFFG
jgi:putative ABC transport system substrate-binding protein